MSISTSGTPPATEHLQPTYAIWLLGQTLQPKCRIEAVETEQDRWLNL